MNKIFFFAICHIILTMGCFFKQLEAQQLIEHEKHHSSVGVTEITLCNGLKVILKPTDFDSDEIFIRLSARGGYSSLSPDKQVSGMLAAQVAWESGLGDMTADKVSSILFKDSLEFIPKINSYNRTIEGSAGTEGLETFFKFTNLLFTSPKFSPEAYKTVLQQTKEHINEKQNAQISAEYTFHDINTQNLIFKNLTLKNLDNFNFLTSKAFFDESYASPADFVCVIVGNFNIETIKPLINKYFASIPHKPTTFSKTVKPVNGFPQGITSKIIKMSGRTKSLTRLTFPLHEKLDEKKIKQLQLICRIIENRLRTKITSKTQSNNGIDVAYEFPYYPALDSWLTIQFCSTSQEISEIKSKIISELKFLQNHGLSQKELDAAQNILIQSDDCWLKDNFSWIGILTNYYLWDWCPEEILKPAVEMKKEEIESAIKMGLILDNYSVVSIQP